MITSSPNNNNNNNNNSLSENGNGQSAAAKAPKKRGFFKRLFSSDDSKTRAKSEAPKTRPKPTSNPELKPKPVTQEAKATTVINPSTPSTTSAKTQQDQQQQMLRSDIFPQNVAKPVPKVPLPKPGARLENTAQLAVCRSILPKDLSSHSYSTTSDDFEKLLVDKPLNETQKAWVRSVVQDEYEHERLESLTTRLVVEFIRDNLKGSSAVGEVMLVSPVLDREHYRKLLTCLIAEFEKTPILNVDLLQGISQLVQCSSPGYLVSDDLVKILCILRTRLEGTHKQSTEYPYHLTVAVSRVLDVMAEHEVEDLDRVLEHEPLSAVLSGLSGSSDPYLMYQASYAFQALQYVPDDETALQAVLRHSTGVADSLIKISGVLKLDLGALVEGLDKLQEVLGETFEIAKSGFDGVCSLIESGQGVIDSLKEGFGAGRKKAWYSAIRGADTFIREGRLADLNRLICEAPCRRDPAFQWGICQRLGEIATDPLWDNITRLRAIDFLGELYKDNFDWGLHATIKKWILNILHQVSEVPEKTIKDHAHEVLVGLEKHGDTVLQELYRISLSGSPNPYPLSARLQKPASPSLLDRVQAIPDVDYDLRKVKLQRLEEATLPVYIPPMAKANLQARDDDLFPLMDKVQDFLGGNGQVMLILGDSGAGKSTFNKHLESELWHSYKTGDRIPLFVNLPALDRPDRNLMMEQLKMHNFSDDQIRELKVHRQFVVICDGYDESKLAVNIHTFNLFNRPGQWNVKLVISCRSQYLSQDYRGRFVPQGGIHYDRLAPDLFQEAVIAPFSREQIHSYVDQYVPLEPRTWSTQDYMDTLTAIPNLMDLVKNPFLLTLALEALPGVTEGKQDLSNLRITRVQLYDTFVQHWLNVNKRRLEAGVFSKEEHDTLDQLLDADFTLMGIEYSMRLSSAIFDKQDGNPVVQYVHLKDRASWKAEFFSPDPEIRFLRDSSPLARSGRLHRFIHRSVLEYFFSCTFYDPNTAHNNDAEFALQSSSTGLLGPISDHPLAKRSLMSEPSIIQFLAERVQHQNLFKCQLLAMVENSKTDPEGAQAASNAITILVKAGVRFSEADLKGIRVPGSSLTGGEFDSAQLQGADLTNANLAKTWLRKANLSGAQMTGTKFGEWPYLKEEASVLSCVFSTDGKMFVLALVSGKIKVYETTKWTLVHTLVGHTESINKVTISTNGLKIASASDDMTIRLWEARSGKAGHVLSGHEGQVSGVAFSPNNLQVVSSSWDSSIRLWNVATGEQSAIFQGHDSVVSSVAFSPTGLLIASTSWDDTVRVWDVKSRENTHILADHTDGVASVAFSPDGIHLASGGWDKTVRVWNVSTGLQEFVMAGHTSNVASVVYSFDGQELVSCGEDCTIRIWDSRTGAPGPVLSGHVGGVTSAVFSPNGEQIASSSFDNTARLWDTKTDPHSATTSTGHTKPVFTVCYSPTGHQILSASWDETARIWDAEVGTPGFVLRGHTEGLYAAAYSPDGQVIATVSGDHTVRTWDAVTGAAIHVMRGHTRQVSSLVFSLCGKTVISASFDRSVRMWDVATGEAGPVLLGHEMVIMSVVLSSDGKYLCSIDGEDSVRLWDATTGEPSTILDATLVKADCFAFSPDGQQIAMGGTDMVSRLWDLQTGEPGHSFTGHAEGILALAYSPAGDQLATSGYDRTVRLGNPTTGESGLVLTGHTASIPLLSYSPDGAILASCSDDKTIRLWETTSGRCLGVIRDFLGVVKSVVWRSTFEGLFMATGCSDSSVRVWQLIKTDDGADDGQEGDGEGRGRGFHERLHWSSGCDGLAVSDANIEGVVGLSKINLALLKQRGVLGDPAPQ